MIRRNAVAENGKHTRAVNIRERGRRLRHIFEIRRELDIGRFRVPLVNIAFWNRHGLPVRVTLEHFAVYLAVLPGGNCRPNGCFDLLRRRPNVFQINGLAHGVAANRFRREVQVHAARKRIGDYERRRGQIVGANQRVDAAFKVAIAAQNCHRDKIVFFDCRADGFRERAAVADAGGAPVADQVEFQFLEIRCQACGLQVVGHHYLQAAGLTPYLEKLKFHQVGYGCTTCIGNSGPLPEAIGTAIKENNLVAVAVLSGNRNFEGRIHPLVRANYLASPPLVVAYALAGRMDLDLTTEPLGSDPAGNPVYLRDIWPTPQEIESTVRSSVSSSQYSKQYSEVFEGDAHWKSMPVPKGDIYKWDPKSTYIKLPPYFENMPKTPPALADIHGAKVLAILGDSVTTDHISPAGSIPVESSAGKYLIANGVKPHEFDSYGARRGNHEVMMRGTFANIRLRNQLAPGTEGGWTLYLPSGEKISIYDAAVKYREAGVPLVVIAGKEYGSGSSRDWAAKGTRLLGVRAVIAESYERIHRSNLIGMGVLPLEFRPGENRESLGLTGHEIFEIEGVAALAPKKPITVHVKSADGKVKTFSVIARADTPEEVSYYHHGGILQYVLRQLL